MGLRYFAWKLLDLIGSGGSSTEHVLEAPWHSNMQPGLRNTTLLKVQDCFLPSLPPTTAHFSSEQLFPRYPELQNHKSYLQKHWELYPTRVEQ